jgi:transcriptional regulator with XRE-family HTH domain
MPTQIDPFEQVSIPDDCTNVGQKVREIRSLHKFGVRDLARKSGISANALSLIESGKSSPTVSTLQRLAHGLDVPITAFFESEPAPKQIVFTPASERPLAEFQATLMGNLGKDLAGNAIQPFVVSLPPKAGSGPEMIVHTGHEFVYCLSGTIRYRIEKAIYELKVGDSLVFESHLPHRWENPTESESEMILVLFHADQHDKLGGHHFEALQPGK